MIIFLHGEDTYRSREKLKEIVEHYREVHKSGLNLKYFDYSNLSFENLKNEFQIAPMFKEKKLIVLENVFSVKEDKSFSPPEEKFLDLIKNLENSEDIILVYQEGQPDSRLAPFKFLKKYSKSQEFNLLEEEKLKDWIKKEFLKFGAGISTQALDKLIYFVGNDLWQMNNEIKKLVSFKLKRRIEAEDVELLVKPKIEADIFKTIDAIAQKNKKQALSLIRKHLEKGDSPLYLLSMINFQFRNLLIIKDLIEKNRPYYAILKTTKLHPFVVKKSYQQASKFTLLELKKIYQKIFQVDLSIKTGKVEPTTALDLLLTEI